MIALRRTAGRIARDRKGATIIEFAMIIPTLCMLLLAVFEIGYRMYVTSVIQGALHDAARMATVGNASNAEVDALIRRRLQEFSRGATIEVTTQSYFDFSQVATPERITQDTYPLGVYNSTDCYEDFNGNGRYDLDRGRVGLGNAEDIVRYQVVMTYPRVFPVMGFLGWGDTDTIRANTVLRNQPYAGRATASPPVRCS